MKFLADQDVYLARVLHLRRLGHDVVAAADLGLAASGDADLLRRANEDGRIFLTRDRDFGVLVFVHSLAAGIIYLRALPSTLKAVHCELERLLTVHAEEELLGAFLVVEPGRHRIRRGSASDESSN